jgi:Leucine-rich repeat (LRR) protein
VFARRRSLQNGGADLSFRLQKLDLSYNQLTGTVNPIAAFVPSLRSVDVSGNQFTGQVSTLLLHHTFHGKSLTQMLFQMHCCTLEQFPGDSGWLGIEYLAMANNLFTGTLPIGWALGLNHLDFSNNSLTEGIPDGICAFQGLTFLGLGANSHLNGTIPSCLSQLSELRSLDLSSSNLEGTISSSIGRLSKLEFLDLSGNRLAGSIPSEIGQCSSLTSFDFSNNKLVGKIPSTLGNLIFLKSLSIGDNALTGTVPSEIGQLVQLESLKLKGNDLEGSLPDGICSGERNWTRVELGCRLKCSCCDKASSEVC